MALIITTVSGCRENARNSETTARARTKNICSCSVFYRWSSEIKHSPSYRERERENGPRERGSAQTGSGSFGVRAQHWTPPWCSRKFHQCNTTHEHSQNMQHTRLVVVALLPVGSVSHWYDDVRGLTRVQLFYPGRTDLQRCAEQDSRSRE